MTRTGSKTRRGQALVMTTLILVAMCGVLGLAVDLSWSYFVRKNAQAHADAGAMAAAEQALRVAGQAHKFATCPPNVRCGAASYVTEACTSARSAADASTNIDNGCVYLRGLLGRDGSYAGFLNGTNGSRAQTAVLDFAPLNNGVAGYIEPGCPTNAAPCGNPSGIPVQSVYWVRARVTETVPQLFSAVLGNRYATVSARATAAIIGMEMNASIVLTNRQNDVSGTSSGNNGCSLGVDMCLGGNASIHVPGNVRLASNKRNPNAGTGSASNYYAGGNTWIRTPGYADWCGSTEGDACIDKPDGNRFADPFYGKGQPAAPSVALPDCGVVINSNGQSRSAVIVGGSDPANPLLLAPGNYYTVQCDNNGNNCSTNGFPVAFSGSVRFTNTRSGLSANAEAIAKGSSTRFVANAGSPCMGGQATGTTSSDVMSGTGTTVANGGFGQYVFWGGMSLSGTNLIIEPGQYFLAGAGSGNLFDVQNNVKLLDLNLSDSLPTNPQSNAGEMFILTKPSYTSYAADGTSTSLATQISAIDNLRTSSAIANLAYGPTYIQGGNTAGNAFRLHGLTPGNDTVENNSQLQPFGSVLFWQDQQNSTVKYTAQPTSRYASGVVDVYTNGCNTVGSGSVSVDNPCRGANYSNPEKAGFTFQGSPSSHIYGIFYQPRGAWMSLGGSPSSSGSNSTMIVTGAMQIQGGGEFRIDAGIIPPIQREVVLVE